MRAIKGDPEFDYYLICNKICGNAHFNMKMKVVVEDEASYNEWIKQQTSLFAEENTKVEDSENTTTEKEILAIN
jgi:cytochrome c oxidase subunit 2